MEVRGKPFRSPNFSGTKLFSKRIRISQPELKYTECPFKVIPSNCIAHPFCASFIAWLARARARARWELNRFSVEAELFREINGRFLPNELGDPTIFFHLCKENTTLYEMFKFEEFFIIQFWNIPVDSLLQSDFRRFTGTVQTLDFPVISN